MDRIIDVGVGCWSLRRFFRGTTLVVKAVRPVEQGRVVGDGYGPVFDKFDTTERRRRLRARYWFECECEACVRDCGPRVDQRAARIPRIR